MRQCRLTGQIDGEPLPALHTKKLTAPLETPEKAKEELDGLSYTGDLVKAK